MAIPGPDKGQVRRGRVGVGRQSDGGVGRQSDEGVEGGGRWQRQIDTRDLCGTCGVRESQQEMECVCERESQREMECVCVRESASEREREPAGNA